jgi:hypothetical protein
LKDFIGETLAAFPPNLIRVLARTGRGNATRNLTHDEVAKRSGLNRSKVRQLSALSSWDRVAIADADAFLRGCNVTLRSLWKQRAFLRRSLDPRETSTPLAYAVRGRRVPRPPSAETLVKAALSRSVRRA